MLTISFHQKCKNTFPAKGTRKIFIALSIPILLLFLLPGCRVSMVPVYNPQLEEQISNAAKANDRLYIDLLDEPKEKRTYENYKSRYNDIESEINSIQLKNEARDHNSDFLVINKNLKNAFAEAKKYHKDHVVLTDGEIKSYQLSIAAFWRPLYYAERGLKISSSQ